MTAFESCQSQQATSLIIEASKCPYFRALFKSFSLVNRGGYPEAPFRTVPVTAMPNSLR